MPIVRVLRDRRFGEGWKIGDVVAMDDEAVRVPLEEGSVELVNNEKEKVVEIKEVPKFEDVFVCNVCGKVCKNKVGYTSHLRSHK